MYRYGDEWEKEVMKNSKKTIVQMLRRVAIERDRLEAVKQGAQRTVCPNCVGEKYVELLDGTRVNCEMCGGTGNSR